MSRPRALPIPPIALDESGRQMLPALPLPQLAPGDQAGIAAPRPECTRASFLQLRDFILVLRKSCHGIVQGLVERDPNPPFAEHDDLSVGRSHSEHEVAFREKAGGQFCGQLLQTELVIRNPSKEWCLEQPATEDVVGQHLTQSRGQLLPQLLLISGELPALLPQELQVVADGGPQLVRNATPSQVLAQHALPLGHRIVLGFHARDNGGKRTHEAREDYGGNEQQDQHEAHLGKVLGRNISIADGRHRGKCEVH
mmetsp:Transcript_31834/g.105525  ORF Transcript_31834/g.105525 Transcript_31834/m.105525 type:complete len:254 (+) Transcript_31834:494-1255(+)